MDEINKKRNDNKVAEGTKQMHDGIVGQESFQEFSQWLLDNMPAHQMQHHANGVVGGITGTIIGTWFDCGATPDLLKEYFTRFVDMGWEQYSAIKGKV